MAAVIDGDRANYISAHPGPAALDPKHRLAGIGQARVGSDMTVTCPTSWWASSTKPTLLRDNLDAACVADVGLAARNVLRVPGVDHHHLEAPLFQD